MTMDLPIGEILVWYSLSGVCLLVAATGIVCLSRALRGQPAFTHRDWHAVFGFPKDKALTAVLWVRVALVNLVVVAVGFSLGFFLLPYGLGWFIAAVAFTVVGVIILLPLLLRSGGQQ
jgi:hypothetical protein